MKNGVPRKSCTPFFIQVEAAPNLFICIAQQSHPGVSLQSHYPPD